MKDNFKKILILSSLVVMTLGVLFTSCDEEEDDYNYDNIEPKLINGIDGPTTATANAITKYKYSVVYRGGSEYDWSVEGNDATIDTDSADVPSIVYITYAQESEEKDVILSVTETTEGGKSVSAEDTISLQPFCPYPVEDYVGDYTGTQAGYHSDPVTMEEGSEVNTLVVSDLAYFVSTAWGETWVEGDGSCVMEFKCGDVVDIPFQWIGDTDYPDEYWIEGSGTVDTDAKVIELDYEVFYGGGTSSAYGVISTTLTLDGKKKGIEVEKFDVEKR